MAAISHVFTIRRAAQILGRDGDLLWELSDQLEPEDGKLWVCDIDGAETPRLHPRWHRGSSRNYQGSDRSRRLISRRVYRGAQRMLTIQRAVVAPQVEIIEKCAARRQIFRDRTPLASRAQNIHDPVHHFAHLDMALVAAALGGRDQWFDMRP